MNSVTNTLYHRFIPSLGCRLCWKITLYVFLSILAVEAIILIPSVKNYEKDELGRLESVALAVFKVELQSLSKYTHDELTIVGQRILASSTPIKGGLVKVDLRQAPVIFGEQPETPMNGMPKGSHWFTHLRVEHGTRYDVSWSSDVLEAPFEVTARLDASSIGRKLVSFVYRIIGLVALIANFVTIATMYVLQQGIIEPILRLRQQQLAACQDPLNPAKYRVEHCRKDELGDLFTSFNHMLSQVSNGLETIKKHEEILEEHNRTLEKRVQERTVDLTKANENLSNEIVERKKYEQKLIQMSNYDVVTELPNKTLYLERLRHSIAKAKVQEKIVAAMVIELNEFQEISDAFGHHMGDQLLKHVGHSLDDVFPMINTSARIGSHHLAIISESLFHLDEVRVLAQKIIDRYSKPIYIDEQSFTTTINIGISIAPEESDDPKQLIRNADLALDKSKKNHPNSFNFYETDMNQKVEYRHNLLVDLHYALVHEELELYYQPQFNLKKNQICGMEVLLRWQHPKKGMISPGDFIPLAEESGLIVPIGEWVLRTACIQAKNWQESGLGKDLCVAINLSAIQFKQDNMVDLVEQVLDFSGLASSSLELEITETVVMNNVESAIKKMNDIKDLGVTLSIDDFGTGYSSLNYLRRFPVHKIKIDQSFVRGISPENPDTAIADAICYLAHSLDLTVIAEGVETEYQLAHFEKIECDEVQGYLKGRPVPESEFHHYFK